MFTNSHLERHIKSGRESIHSGHFMVSQFEAEEQDDEDEVAVPVPEDVNTNTTIVPVKQFCTGVRDVLKNTYTQQHLEIDTSLSKLFQCMTLAYRQKLTSPKWNRFRGIRLRWKEKIRLNNVIWRCWHLQFIKKENTLICQFASPLDVDTHNKPEAVVLEGKYWKRKLHAVTAEYKKWRMFHRHHSILHHLAKDSHEMQHDVDLLSWDSPGTDSAHMLVDEDYMGLMSDTLFSTIANQPFHFPDSREIAKAGLADFIQPSLGPLQPNLDDYMDTFEPDFMNCKLPTVPEEQNDGLFKPSLTWAYELDLLGVNSTVQINTVGNTATMINQEYNQLESIRPGDMDNKELINSSSAPTSNFSEMMLQQSVREYVQRPPQSSASLALFQTTSISKNKQLKQVSDSRGKYNQNQISQNIMYNKPIENLYQDYQPAPQCLQLATLSTQTRQQPQTPVQSQVTTSEAQQFGLPQVERRVTQAQGYKFPTPPPRPNIKFTSQVSQLMNPAHSHYNTSLSFAVKEEKIEQPREQNVTRGRQRSRSSTREPVKRPPLISAVSDPALLTHANSALLTQLLSNNASDNAHVFNQNQSIGTTLEQSSQILIKEENGLSQPTALIIASPVINSKQSPNSDPLMLNSYSNSNSPVLDTSSQYINSPTSSQGSLGSPNRDTPGNRDHRRAGHIHAEQKRRYNIKNGFDMIHSLIPHLNQNPNAKLSKAAMLQKGAEYIRQLRTEREQLKEEMNNLKQQIETLNLSISNCQSMLPTNITPISIRRDGKMQELFDEYVRSRMAENWKFWIFSLMFRPLLTSFNNVVSTSSLDDLYRTTIVWVEQHCTLGDLRPVVLNSLRYLSTTTDILSNPEKLPEEARQISLSRN